MACAAGVEPRRPRPCLTPTGASWPPRWALSTRSPRVGLDHLNHGLFGLGAAELHVEPGRCQPSGLSTRSASRLVQSRLLSVAHLATGPAGLVTRLMGARV